MLIQRALLGLPTSLLLLVLAQAKDVYEQQQHRQIIPLAIRKMGLDEGEKFYPEQYYGFEGSDDDERVLEYGDAKYRKTDSFGRSLASLFSFGRRSPSIATAPDSLQERRDDGRWPVAARRTFPRDGEEEGGGEETERDGDASAAPAGNSSENAEATARLFPQAYLPPFSIHHASDKDTQGQSESENESWELFRRAGDALARLQRRQWGCPTGTTSCADIKYPYSCCSNTETCYKVTDTGRGPVGCCPAGSSCGGAVATCASDSTPCPSSLGGGCCIAGYVCEGVGCVKSSATGTATATGTGTSTGTPTSASSTTTSSQITSTPSQTSTTTSGDGVAPVKPTPKTTAPGLPAGYCPTGYYACLASAGGGCCQTGRDCKTTNCPPAPSNTTIVNTNGMTVVVPATAAAAAATASPTCASGWFLCGANAGPVAGCCPSGYNCGTASCSLTGASATTEVQKELPTSNGSSSGSGPRAVAVSIAGSLCLALAAAMAPRLLVW